MQAFSLYINLFTLMSIIFVNEIDVGKFKVTYIVTYIFELNQINVFSY